MREIHRLVLDGEKGTRLDGTGVRIAIIDSAADLRHASFRKGHTHKTFDFITDNQAGEISHKEMYHGTMVAGIIAADGRSDRAKMHGVAPGAELYSYRVTRRGRIHHYALEKSLICAMESKVDIINISLQNFPHNAGLHYLIQEASQMGITIIAQAGNGIHDGTDNIEYPAAYQETIAVGAHQKGRAEATHARGQLLELTAPGDGVYSLAPGDTFGYGSGSSYASPFVTGLAALIIQAWRLRHGRSPGPLLVRRVLRQCTHTDSFHRAYGYGKVMPDRLAVLITTCGADLPPKAYENRYQF